MRVQGIRYQDGLYTTKPDLSTFVPRSGHVRWLHLKKSAMMLKIVTLMFAGGC